jgi:hypothetical protein
MLTDAMDAVAARTGLRAEGLTFGVLGVLSKWAIGGGAFVAGAIVSRVGLSGPRHVRDGRPGDRSTTWCSCTFRSRSCSTWSPSAAGTARPCPARSRRRRRARALKEVAG